MVTAVCTGGDTPPMALSLLWLEACQRTVAADGGLSLFRHHGRQADLWIGDGDSLPGTLAEWAPWFRESRILPRAKDDTDTEAAVQAALDLGSREVWLLGGGGGRMDHWWANLRLFASQPRLTRWLTAHEEAWNLGTGDTLVLSAGVVSIFPLGLGPWSIQSQGLRWPLESVDFTRWHSLANEVTDQAQFMVHSGQFLVLRPLREDRTP